ncbi:MAG TPA: bifunctional diguanylate cyclase/phosphodiesterase, partial [Chromatiales bacterium]|nr:bifunctional diguanylate cyclase/phosphodiesterase [Chromatiales bacterium]
ALLRLVATRLRAVLRDEDLIARQGGDEFLVLVTGSDRGREASPSRRRGPGARQDPGEAIVHQATAVAEKLLEALRQPFRLGEMDFYLRASIGISVFPDHADSVDTMLQFADAAMYRAKALGTGGYRFYTADLSERQHQRLKLERRLHKALERKEFLLHYQPLVDLSSGRMIGVEALIRWQDPLDGLIAPADFLAVAEASGMINPVGEWVLGEACRQLADWRRRGIGLKMAINLSVRQFWHVDMTALVERVAAEAGIPFDALELEVTESAMMLEEGALEQQVRALAKAGFSISLDDFGTGYSSLSRLSELPIHVLKIDKSFIDGLLVDPQRWAIVDTVVRFARHLGIQCLAEGIETAEQWAELRRLGCHAGQGYLFCRPCPAVEVEAAYAAPPWKAPPWSHPPASSQPPEIVS